MKGNGSISMREILRLALPALVAGIAEPLIGLADTAIIGRVGTTELGAVGLGASFYTFMIWVFSQTRSAASAIISRAVGNGKLEETKSLVPQAIFTNFLLGVGLIALTLPFATEIFQFYKATGDQLEFCKEYYYIRVWGFPITLATMLMFGTFRGLQNTSWAMIISLVGGAVNLVLDIALVYGIDGLIDPMGVKGAALASLIAQVVMLVLAIGFLYAKTPYSLLPTFKPSPYLLQLLGMSLNLFARTIALNVAYFLANRYATSYGEAYIGAHTIAMQIWLFSAFFIDGFANAGNAMSGKLLGSDDLGSLAWLAKRLNRISVLISLGLSAVYLGGYFATGALFSDDAFVIACFESIYWLVILSQPINAIAFTYDGIFKGLGDTAYLRNTLLAATFLGFIPTLLILDYFDLQLYGIWCAFLVFMLIRMGSLWWRFRVKYVRTIS